MISLQTEEGGMVKVWSGGDRDYGLATVRVEHGCRYGTVSSQADLTGPQVEELIAYLQKSIDRGGGWVEFEGFRMTRTERSDLLMGRLNVGEITEAEFNETMRKIKLDEGGRDLSSTA